MTNFKHINIYRPILLIAITAVFFLFVLPITTAAFLQLDPQYGAPIEGTQIAETCTAGRSVTPNTVWCFENGLGLIPLGNYTLPTGEDCAGLTPIILFGWLFVFGLGLAAVLALVMIVFGGVRYIVGAGNSGQQEKAKETIRNALLGLILAMASTLILYTINPNLTTIGLPALLVEDSGANQQAIDVVSEMAQRPEDVCDSETDVYVDPPGAGQEGAPCTTNDDCAVRLDCVAGECTDTGEPIDISSCLITGCPDGSTCDNISGSPTIGQCVPGDPVDTGGPGSGCGCVEAGEACATHADCSSDAPICDPVSGNSGPGFCTG